MHSNIESGNGMKLHRIITNIIRKKLNEQTQSNTLYYRGAETNEFGKGDFDGIWLSTDERIANQYGEVHKYLGNGLNLLDSNSADAREIEEYFSKKYPKLLDYYNQDGDFTELWMFPPKEFIEILKEDGYDGYNNGSDTFVFNYDKIKPIKNNLKNQND